MISKYDNIKFFKKTKARVNHICSNCGTKINKGDIYYPEVVRDKFLYSLHNKKLCRNCYENINK